MPACKALSAEDLKPGRAVTLVYDLDRFSRSLVRDLAGKGRLVIFRDATSLARTSSWFQAATGEGLGDTLTPVWSDFAVLMYVAPAPGRRVPSAMYTLGKGQMPMRVKKWREEALEGDFVEVSTDFLPFPMATSAAFYWKDVD